MGRLASAVPRECLCACAEQSERQRRGWMGGAEVLGWRALPAPCKVSPSFMQDIPFFHARYLHADVSEILEQVAYLGMAAQLAGPMFTADVRNPEASQPAGTLSSAHSFRLRVLHSLCLAPASKPAVCTDLPSCCLHMAGPGRPLPCSLHACDSPTRAKHLRALQGWVFSWADRMLSSAARRSSGAGGGGGSEGGGRLGVWGPPKHAVARSGLRYLLQASCWLHAACLAAARAWRRRGALWRADCLHCGLHATIWGGRASGQRAVAGASDSWPELHHKTLYSAPAVQPRAGPGVCRPLLCALAPHLRWLLLGA